MKRGIPFVDAFIGLSGVYNIKSHYEFERNRGVHEISPMTPASSGKENFDFCSPLQIAQNMLQEGYSIRLRSPMPVCCFIHGLNDFTVPVEASRQFADCLKKFNQPVWTYYINVSL